MSDIFREIDEELRRDNLLKLWSRYGRYIVGGRGSGAGRRRRDRRVARPSALRAAGSIRALFERPGAGESRQDRRCGDGVRDDRQGRRRLIRCWRRSKTRRCWPRRATAKKPPRPMTRIAEAERGQPDLSRPRRPASRSCRRPSTPTQKQRSARLAPLTAAGSPWRPTALELTAAAQLKLGDKKAALEIYKGLADDLTAPRSLRARAAEMAAALAS